MTFGIVILQADTHEAAQVIMKNGPAVDGGVVDTRLHAFRIAIQADQ
jgi:hypothetical protein